MTLIVLALVPVACLLSGVMTWYLVGAGRASGAVDSSGATGHEKTLRCVPNIGGIAIVTAIVMPILLGLTAIQLDVVVSWFPALGGVLSEAHAAAPRGLGLVGGIMVMHLLGLVDDRRSLDAMPKLLVQASVAAIMVIGFDVRLLTVVDAWMGTGPIVSTVVTIIWIVAMSNAVNFMDNMDGLAGGVVAIAATLFMVGALINAQWFVAATLALVVGATIGFLIFNFPPAKIFMGDGGSLVLGFVLAVLTAQTTFYDPEWSPTALGGAWYGIFMPLIVLAVPLYDFVTVTVIRISKGQSPFVGDQQHFSHRLVARGLSERGSVMTIWCLTAVIGITGVFLGTMAPWQAMLAGVQVVLLLAILAALERKIPGVSP
jgi:UDP-GlcNAc:undecaprenyl-phosphate GlcNAc-1-phosphate transferase